MTDHGIFSPEIPQALLELAACWDFHYLMCTHELPEEQLGQCRSFHHFSCWSLSGSIQVSSCRGAACACADTKKIIVLVFTNWLAITSASTLSKRTTGAPQQLHKSLTRRIYWHYLKLVLLWLYSLYLCPTQWQLWWIAALSLPCSDLHIPLSPRARTPAPHGQGWVL